MERYAYGQGSSAKLATCHEDLQLIAPIVLARSPYDITIVHGWRGRQLQNQLVLLKASKTPWPDSKHNHTIDDGRINKRAPCSLAIDFAPWVNNTIPWDDTHIFAFIAGIFRAVASEFDIELVWGGDFDGDGSSKDQTLLDWGHIHIVPK